jgi:hypothetical protein
VSNSTKAPSKLDFEQILKNASNENDKSLATSSYIDGAVGRAIERTAVSPTVDEFAFYEGATLIKTIRVTWTTSAKEEFTRVERIN